MKFVLLILLINTFLFGNFYHTVQDAEAVANTKDKYVANDTIHGGGSEVTMSSLSSYLSGFTRGQNVYSYDDSGAGSDMIGYFEYKEESGDSDVYRPFYIPLFPFDTCESPEEFNPNTKQCEVPPPPPKETSREQDDDFTFIYYDNGSAQVCNTYLGTCKSYDKNGNKIPNIPIDGVTYADNFNDLVAQRFLTVAGTTILIGTAGLLTVLTGGLALAPATAATIGTGGLTVGLSMTMGGALGDSEWTVATAQNSSSSDNIASTENGIKIDLTKYEATEYVTTTVDNPILTQIHSNYNKDGDATQKIEVTDTEIISKTTMGDGTTETVTIPKTALTAPTTNDFSEQNNLPKIDYTVKVTIPEKINNDGTTTTAYNTTYARTSYPQYNTTTTRNTQSSGSVTSASSVDSNSTSSSSSNSTTTNSDGTTESTQTTATTQDLKPITDRLDQMMNQNTNLANKMGTKVAQEDTQKEILEKLKEQLDKTLTKEDMTEAMKDAMDTNNTQLTKQDLTDAFLDALNQHDGNSTSSNDSNSTSSSDSNSTSSSDSNSTSSSDSNSSDSNSSDSNNTVYSTSINLNKTNGLLEEIRDLLSDGNSTGDGDGNSTGPDMDDVEGAIFGEYGKALEIFSTNCGNPQFDPGVTVMGVFVANPLKIADEKLNSYYDQIKYVFIFLATFAGLISIFRR